MERSGSNRKRAREENGIEEEEEDLVSRIAKIKPDLTINDYYIHREFNGNLDATNPCYNKNNINNSNVSDAGEGEEGLFDFPWLKEGTIFTDEDQEEFDFDNVFASSYNYSSNTPAADASDSKAEEQNLCQFPKLPNFDDDDKNMINYEDGSLLLPLFQADQLEGPDWICSSVFD